MRVVVAVVGKPRDANLAAAIREYETRAARYWPLDVREVREESAVRLRGAARASAEGERLLAAIPPAAQVVACDVSGRSFTSEQLRASGCKRPRERAARRGLRDRRRVRARRRRSRAGRRRRSRSRRGRCRTSWRASCSPSSCTAPGRSSAASRITSEARARHRTHESPRGSHRIARRVAALGRGARRARAGLVPGAATRRARVAVARARCRRRRRLRLARRALAGVRRERRRGAALGAERERTGHRRHDGAAARPVRRSAHDARQGDQRARARRRASRRDRDSGRSGVLGGDRRRRLRRKRRSCRWPPTAAPTSCASTHQPPAGTPMALAPLDDDDSTRSPQHASRGVRDRRRTRRTSTRRSARTLARRNTIGGAYVDAVARAARAARDRGARRVASTR